jgi:MoaA/NifB/PqqE/SkfB family radical SAM enzyme
MKLSILYRGPLASCNYSCWYCPFTKNVETPAEREKDRQALDRFVNWVEQWPYPLQVFFTPRGEALPRKRYQHTLIRLSHMNHVDKIAIQTNLSCRLDWVKACRKESLGLWTTFHPGQEERSRFLAKCLEMDKQGVRFSVGVVGVKQHLAETELLRQELPPNIYLWVNAYKRAPHYYTEEDLERWTAIDPLFPINNGRPYASLGQACRCGDSVIAVDGEGTIQRCYFVPTPIGSIYDPGFKDALKKTTCPNEICGCHIGYVHMDRLGLYEVFGGGVLERIPALLTRWS